MTTNTETQRDPKKSAQHRAPVRRSEDELIQDLEAKIREIEDRKRRREQQSSPLHKDLARFKKQAAKFAQSCTDEGRPDIANSVLGMISVAESQVRLID